MARDDEAPTAPGAGGTDGVSRGPTASTGNLAHTMALCGLGKVRAQPRETGTRST
jgi:hypothetical protein